MSKPGDLDTTFGTGGKVTTDFSSGPDIGNSVVLQPDGKIILGGRANNSQNSNSLNQNFALARYMPNGLLDTTFGTGGKVTTDFFSNSDSGNSVVLQPDGKIILAGRASNGSNQDFALVRYMPNGSLDTTFGTGGKVTTDFYGVQDVIRSIILQPDGKIIVGGNAYNGTNQNFALVRYMPDGLLDTTFGTGGKVTTDFFSNTDTGNSVVLQPDSKIIMGGTSNDGTNTNFAIARYMPDGSLDITFGTGGKVTTDFFGYDDNSNSLVLQQDGKIILGGTSNNGTNDNFAIARYMPDGSLDITFGTGGKVTTDFFNNTDDGNSLALQPDGKIILAGSAGDSTTNNFALARYMPDGSLDITFGTGGKVTTSFNGEESGGKLLFLQPDGKIILGGTSNNNFALARYIGILNTIQSGGDPIIKPLLGSKFSLAPHIKFVNLLADYKNKVFINAHVQMLNQSDFPAKIFWDTEFTETSKLNHMYNTSYYRKFHITFGLESIEIDADTLKVTKLSQLTKLKYINFVPKYGLKSISFDKTYPLFISTKGIKIGLGDYLLNITSDINTDDRHYVELINVKYIDLQNTCGALISKDQIIRISNLFGPELYQFDSNPFTSNQLAL